MSKIKVLHIIKSLGRGGAEMLLPETLKLHNQDKFEFHYIYFLPWKDQMVSAIKDLNANVTCLSAKNNIQLIRKYHKISEYCKKHKIDIIHCHLPWAGFVGRIVFKYSGIPVIYTEHNMQERYHTVTKVLNKISFNFQTLAFGVSEDVTGSIRKNINPKIPVETLLNGVNTDSFYKAHNLDIKRELGIPEDSIVIGNVAVFRFQKRLVEWLNVFKCICNTNKKVYGLIVGAGPLENEIKAEARKLGLERNIIFPGLQKDVKPYFEVMDIFMMSSSFEGLPIALLEAMSMECAIVSTNAGGIKEVIRHEKDGLICDVSDWKDLAHLVQELINSPSYMKALKVAARKRVKEKFSLKRMVLELENHYCEITGNI